MYIFFNIYYIYYICVCVTCTTAAMTPRVIVVAPPQAVLEVLAVDYTFVSSSTPRIALLVVSGKIENTFWNGARKRDAIVSLTCRVGLGNGRYNNLPFKWCRA